MENSAKVRFGLVDNLLEQNETKLCWKRKRSDVVGNIFSRQNGGDVYPINLFAFPIIPSPEIAQMRLEVLLLMKKRIITSLLVLCVLVSLCPQALAYSTVQNGSTGSDVKTLQTMLNTVSNAGLTVDGKFGANTQAAVKKFQSANGLTADGICGAKTWAALTTQYNAIKSYSTVRNGSSGNDVRTLQTMLNAVSNAGLTVDGKFGANTQAAVKKFQSANGLAADGICGVKTWAALVSRYNASRASSNTFIWPLSSSFTKITSYTGNRVNPITNQRQNHGGIDISATKGAAVYASAGGTLYVGNSGCTHNYGKSTSCGCGGGYGNYVYIKHSNGTYTYYAHLSTVDVKSGSTVSQGQKIGTVGSTGSSTGYHLHFEMRSGSSSSTRVDPLNYVSIPGK